MKAENRGSDLPEGMFAAVPRKVKLLIYLAIPALIGFGYFFIAISAHLPELGISASYVGLILATFSVATIVASIPLGIVADRRGRKGIILFAFLGIPFVFAVYGLTTNVTVILIVSVLAGLTEAAFLTAWNALIADMTTVQTRNAAFALSFIVNSAATGIGFFVPFVFPFIEDSSGWSSKAVHSGAFLIFGVIAAISPVLYWKLFKGYKESPKETPREKQKFFVRGESTSLVLRFSAINSLIGLGAGFIIPLVPTWLFLEFNAPDSVTGPLVGLSGILMAVSAVASVKMAKRYGDVPTIVLTEGSSTVFMFALAFSPNALTAASLYLVRTALMNMASPVSDSYLMGIISEKERGFASAINGIVWRLPNSVSTVVGGVLLAKGMFALPFFLAAGMYSVAIALFYAYFKDIKQKK